MTQERLELAEEVAAATGGYFRAGKGPKDERTSHPVRRATEAQLRDWYIGWGLDYDEWIERRSS